MNLAGFLSPMLWPPANAQQGDLAEAEWLNRQVLQALTDGRRYEQAIPLAQRALEISEKALGPEHPDTATLFNNLASLYHATGAYAKAESLFARALKIREKALGPEHPDTAQSLNNLAELYRATGAYAKAEPLYQRALKIREKALGPEHPDTAQSLNNLALLYHATGAYAKAEPLFARALKIREKALGPEHPDTAQSLNNLAELYSSTGDYAQAEPLYQRALKINEKALGSEHPATANSLNNLAGLYRATGAYAQAEPLYQRALKINEKALGSEHPATASSLNNLAGLYSSTGAYAQAEPLFARALKIREKALGPEHPATATSLNNLALLYHATGAYAKAEPLFARALKITEEALGPEHPDTAQSLNNLAGLYSTTGDYAKAEPLYQRALKITEEALGPEHSGTATTLNNLAGLYYATGAYAKAEPLSQRAQDIQEAHTTRFLLSGDEARKREYQKQNIGNAYIDVSFSLAVADPAAKALGLTAVLRYKGRVLDAMTDSFAALRRSADPQDRALWDQLRDVARQQSMLNDRGPGQLSPQDYRQRLDALAQQQSSLEATLSARSAAFRQALTPVTLDGVRQGLPAGAALVEWFLYQPFDPKAKDPKTKWGAPRYVAYVLRHQGALAAIDIGAARDIDALVADLRKALQDFGDSQDNDNPAYTASYNKAAQRLYGQLMEPLRPYISGADRLLLSPDGALNLLPFAALVDQHGDYVAQHIEVAYLASGRDLMNLTTLTQEPARQGPVVMADPAYDGDRESVQARYQLRGEDRTSGGEKFRRLPGTAKEAEKLQRLLKLDKESVFTGTDATEEKLKALHGPRILHVATHGFFHAGENPMLSTGLALANANQRRSGANDDGILTAAEAALLDLRGTQLVVLSACETGLGQVQQGEGVYGLRRALGLAGTRTQVVSLWKVADDQTQALMVDYYGRLLQGEGRSAALRAAQQAMLANSATRHPFYWAAFLPIGDWTPLTADKR